MDGPTEIYIEILSFVYPTFLFTTLISHLFLLIFIIFFSPPHLKFLRILLLTTSIFDVLATVINFYVQPRIVSGEQENVPVQCYGLCRYMYPEFCFAFYMGWQTISLAVGASMTYTLFFKYYKITRTKSLSGWRLFLSLVLFYTPCLISMICSAIIVMRNTTPANLRKNSEEKMGFNPRYLEMGRMTLGALPNRINFLMMAQGIYVSPFLSFWFRWKANKNLKDTVSGGSLLLQKHTKSVMKGISLQVFIHFVCYIPLFSLYTYSILSETEILAQQFFLAMSPNLAATFDPLINLYFVLPYRKQIKSWFCKEHTPVAPSGIISRHLSTVE
ncbi:Protein CBR-SRD-35 [Caenorhabditis briggsae]|uniref:Protein CBR-SRD-35 n=2 Tax=Caenorhabditis briggsae TaxID=6238 RepID=A8X8Z7_CAEBR|nr:Protein CBR-SRD-35 [Caenorhabditis briggsae]ULT89817.1 hypothetical protein L3Y34_008313 [Caenorhabditis briggsae]CAP29108.2 Protein CBR-SRD-35 [Caenorhabditis briggsae]